jgi:hypothetical protein
MKTFHHSRKAEGFGSADSAANKQRLTTAACGKSGETTGCSLPWNLGEDLLRRGSQSGILGVDDVVSRHPHLRFPSKSLGAERSPRFPEYHLQTAAAKHNRKDVYLIHCATKQNDSNLNVSHPAWI